MTLKYFKLICKIYNDNKKHNNDTNINNSNEDKSYSI